MVDTGIAFVLNTIVSGFNWLASTSVISGFSFLDFILAITIICMIISTFIPRGRS